MNMLIDIINILNHFHFINNDANLNTGSLRVCERGEEVDGRGALPGAAEVDAIQHTRDVVRGGAVERGLCGSIRGSRN